MQEMLSKTCKKCYKVFSVLGSLRRHEAKSNCGTIAKKWGNLPHKCLMCAEEPLYVIHESYIVHTNLHHGGKFRYLVPKYHDVPGFCEAQEYPPALRWPWKCKQKLNKKDCITGVGIFYID